MPRQEHRTGPRIVAGVDGSPSSLSALRWAIRQAGLTGATVDAVMAWQYPAAADGYGWARARQQVNAAVEVEGGTKRFGGTLALDYVSFSVQPGDVLGPNGAGKTTLIQVLTSL
jgi:ABC-type bacteriocin/lantibiotic exporter with double-glycine peptidase domain